MKKISTLVCLFIITITGCKSSAIRTPHARHISPGMAHNLILQQQQNAQFKIIDVRTESEFNTGHILGAINIDWNTKKNDLLRLSKTDTILIYCRSGRRSRLAMDFMKENSFNYLFQMDGGLVQWQKEFKTLTPSPTNEI